ncbi:hypothetical protein FQZ97_626420 [compost metagenome]
MVPPEAGHLQRIADAAAGLLGQLLERRVHVVVRHQHGAFPFEQRPRPIGRGGLFAGRQRLRHARPGAADGAGAARSGGQVEFDGPGLTGLHGCLLIYSF